MRLFSLLVTIFMLPVSTVISAESDISQLLSEAIKLTGKAYRDMVVTTSGDENLIKQLESIIRREPADSTLSRQARIMVARIEYPDVFAGLASEIQMWRDRQRTSPSCNRPGSMSGLLYSFIMKGPESKNIYVSVDIENEQVASSSRPLMRGIYRKQVTKFTEAEVVAGIARNAAARQALLEFFLKFLNEGCAYEQSDIIDLVDRLWGDSRSRRTGDLRVVDHVQDFGLLIEAIFLDSSWPTSTRMRAAFYLSDAKSTEVQAFMLNVVTNTPTDITGHQRQDIVNQALSYLEYVEKSRSTHFNQDND